MAYFQQQQQQQQPQGGPSQPSPFAQQSSFYTSSAAPNPNTQSFSGPQFGGGSSSGWGGASGSPAGGAGGYGQFGGGGYGGGGGGGQPQFGGGMQGVGGSGGMPTNFGEKAKRNYLPGYLSSGGAMGQSEATPPQNGGDDSRTWDSPASRTSISGSPVSRFGTQSLFGSTRDGTPSRSPKASYSREPRAQLYRTEMEEDAPPISSLTESHSAESLTDFSAPAPSVSPLPSTSPLPPLHPAPSPTGYALHLFGFPSTSLQLVLSHFAQFGDILETTPSPSGGNWVTITYAQPWAAARAARRNGEIIGGVLMIGVKVVDEESLRTGLGPEQPTQGAETKVAAPVRAPASGVGKPVMLGAGSAFKAAAPTPPRRGFFGSGEPVVEGKDPHASLFGEKNRQAVLAQGQGQKGVLGKVSDMVFGW